jgi:alpha-galactosidase
MAIALTLVSCGNDPGSGEAVLKIEHGPLVFEVNGHMETRISSSNEEKPLMNTFQASEHLETEHMIFDQFAFDEVKESIIQGNAPGKQWVLDGVREGNSPEIRKILTIRAYDNFPGLISTEVTYINQSGNDLLLESWSNNSYEIMSQGDNPLFWAFQGSSSGSRSDWVRPLEPGYYQENFLGMNDTDYGGGIPVTSVWRSDINVAVGHLAPVPKLVSLPTEMPADRNEVKIEVQKEFEDRTLWAAGDSLETLETFVSLGKGDYYENLSNYSLLMQEKGLEMVETEDAAFESIWCAWGYERDFTLDEIIGTLPKVKELGIKWAVLDDGFQIAEGDWNANPDKFPRGNSELKGLVNTIHDAGLKAKIWWTPLAADPGSKILEEAPRSKIVRKDGSPQFISWWNAYYLSPTKEATITHTKETIRLFMEEWGFDGLKMDGQHMNAVAPDFSLDDPISSVEGLPEFFHMIYEEARRIKPNAVVENCPCGTCMSFYNMASMNQAVSSDPLSSWQIRHKGKTYKALVPHTAYYGDHVELSDGADDFASSFGVGAVLGTKFTWPEDNPNASGRYQLTPEKEEVWKKWFSLYNEMMLSKADYLGGLYDIGYDRPESHAIQKGERIYYAFYADSWEGPVTLKGLKDGQIYKVRDYFNDVDLGEVSGKEPILPVAFKDNLLLEASPN